MSNKDAHTRLTQVIDYLESMGKIHKQRDIVAALGIAESSISKALKGDPKYFTKGFLKRFAAAYSDYINAEFLIDGTGPMERPARNTRPHIPSAVAAGFTGVAIATVPESDVIHRPLIDIFPSYDFTIGVTGDSMVPMLADGDIIACRRIESPAEIKPHHAYVLETSDGAVVKEIARVSPSAISLHSLNTSYPDYTVSPSTVLSISQVVGIIRSVTP